MTALAMKINTVTPRETIAPETKSKDTPDMELTTYESICTKRNDQKKVQKKRTTFHLLPILRQFYSTICVQKNTYKINFLILPASFLKNGQTPFQLF